MLTQCGSGVFLRRWTALGFGAGGRARASADWRPSTPTARRALGIGGRLQGVVGGHAFRRLDLTRQCDLSTHDQAVASLSGALIRGRQDGKTELVIRYETLEVRVPVVVAGVDTYPPVHFKNDIIPLFSKLRCNSSGCHGKQSGQNGFKLSVFGFDPTADFSALVNAGRGRRVFPAAPEQSLLLLKATGLMPHGGGRRADPDSLDAEILRAWIAQGTRWGQTEAPQLSAIEVEPLERIIASCEPSGLASPPWTSARTRSTSSKSSATRSTTATPRDPSCCARPRRTRRPSSCSRSTISLPP